MTHALHLQTIELDKAKAVEIRDELQYMHNRLGAEPGAIVGLVEHLTELIEKSDP